MLAPMNARLLVGRTDFFIAPEPLPSDLMLQFQWQGWDTQLTMKDHGKTAVFEFIRNHSSKKQYDGDGMSLLTSMPPVEAIGIGLAANPKRAGPIRQIIITDPFGTKQPKLLPSNQQMQGDCGLPRPKQSFDLHMISSTLTHIMFVTLTNTPRQPVLSGTPLITPLRT
jgi:hypothetical protein